MKKRIISLVLTLAMVLTIIPASEFSSVYAQEAGTLLMSLTRQTATIAEEGNRFYADSGVFANVSGLTAWDNNTQITVGGTGRTPIVINNAALAGQGEPAPNNGWKAASVFGVDNASAFQITFSTLGYDDIRFSASQKSTGSGPDTFKLAYRIGSSGAFIPINNSAVTPPRVSNDSYDALVQTYANFTLPAAVNNQAVVELRIYFDGLTNLGRNGNTSVNNIWITSGIVEQAGYISPADRRVDFSRTSGFYGDAFDLALSTPVTDGIIRYTLDGSEPTFTGGSAVTYTAPFRVRDRSNEPNALGSLAPREGGNPPQALTKGTVVRAKVFSADGRELTAKTFTHSYFVGIVGKYGNMPVISLTTESKNLFDPQTGIYMPRVPINDHHLSNNRHLYNFEQRGNDWERPVHFEIIEPDGTTHAQDMGVRIHGGWSRRFAQKSLRLYARGSYDPDHPTLKYDMFKGANKDVNGKPITEFQRILLRNGGNDNYSAMMRDSLLQANAEGLKVQGQSYRQSIVFINGEFWGYYDIRDRVDEYYYRDKFALDDRRNIGYFTNAADDVIFPEELEDDPNDPALLADWAAYQEMYRFFAGISGNMTNAQYQQAQRYLDMENFIDYWAYNFAVGQGDWPHNNLNIWRYRTDYPTSTSVTSYNDGRWRYNLRDLDFAFGLHTAVPLGTVMASDMPQAIFLQKLMTNPTFRARFHAQATHINSVYMNPNRVIPRINAFEAIIAPVMNEHNARWGRNWRASSVEALRNYARGRQSSFTNEINALNRTHTVTFNLGGGNRTGGGALIQSNVPHWSAATAPTATRAGHTFSGWSRTFGRVTGNITVNAQWTVNNYTVTLNPNSGALATAQRTRTVAHGAQIGTLPTPTRAGHRFDGWFTAQTGGTRVTNTTQITSARTIFARWVRVHTVTFDVNGGASLTATNRTRTRDNNTTIGALPTPTRSGHTFAGWFTTRTGGTRITATTRITADTTYFARWVQNPARPANPRAAANSRTEITVSWNRVTGATGYEVWRSTSANGTFTRVRDVTSGATLSWRHTGLTADRQYFYRVRAYRTVNGVKAFSPYTATFSARTRR
jgi:uncharacterized repeat protein (TIGR02543 family)